MHRQVFASGWILCKIISFQLLLYRFKIVTGGKSVLLPNELMSKHCVINLDTDHCFKWAVLSCLHFNEIPLHRQRIENYNQWANDYEFPTTAIVTASQVSDFVKKNKLPVFTHL